LGETVELLHEPGSRMMLAYLNLVFDDEALASSPEALKFFG
jgi:hypothetical protein